MMGLLGNVAEVQFLRHHLMIPLFVSIFRSALIDLVIDLLIDLLMLLFISSFMSFHWCLANLAIIDLDAELFDIAFSKH